MDSYLHEHYSCAVDYLATAAADPPDAGVRRTACDALQRLLGAQDLTQDLVRQVFELVDRAETYHGPCGPFQCAMRNLDAMHRLQGGEGLS